MREFLRCYVNHSNSGFFCQVQLVLHQAQYAERNDLVPVAYISRDALDGSNPYYCQVAGDNIWEYYFEPIGNVQIEDVWRKLDSELGTRLSQLTCGELWRLHFLDGRSLFTYPYALFDCVSAGPTADLEAWYQRMRARGAALVKKFVQVKPHIQDKVDAFVAENFVASSHMIACHLRGTDKSDTGTGRLSRIIPPSYYFDEVDMFLSEHPEGKIFVATDQSQFRKEFISKYADRVVYYDGLLADGNVNIFQKECDQSSWKSYKKGEDVLIDCLLCARCSMLLKCTSAVGEFAMYFNPQMRCTDMNIKLRGEHVVPHPLFSGLGKNPTQKLQIRHANTAPRGRLLLLYKLFYKVFPFAFARSLHVFLAWLEGEWLGWGVRLVQH